jgi:hypothetical protein
MSSVAPTPSASHRSWGTGWTVVLACIAAGLVIWCNYVAVKIEDLNTRAGGVLPRQLPEHGNPKWREVAARTDRVPPSPATVARRQLRAVVMGEGLMQYVLAPTAMLLSWVAAFLIGSLIAVGTLALAFHRAYFESLGY